MKRTLIPSITLAALLLFTACAAPDTGDRHPPTTTTPTQQNPPSPAVAELVWSSTDDFDPWSEQESAQPLSLGQLYYKLTPKLAENQTTDASTRYVMSFTYITADYSRHSLEEYLLDRKFTQHTFASQPTSESGQSLPYVMVFDLTEAEIKSITPESVQAYYHLDSAPAVVGIHREFNERNVRYNVNAEMHWYRSDLMWGETYYYFTDDVKILRDQLYFYSYLSPLSAASWGWTANTKCAVVVCFNGITEGAENYFVSKEIELLPFQYSEEPSSAFFGEQALIEITLGDLWELTIEDMESFYGCDLSVTCFLAISPTPEDIAASQK